MRNRTCQILNLSDIKSIRYKNLSNTEPVSYRTYQMLYPPDTGPIRYRIYQIPTLADTKTFWFWTFQIPSSRKQRGLCEWADPYLSPSYPPGPPPPSNPKAPGGKIGGETGPPWSSLPSQTTCYQTHGSPGTMMMYPLLTTSTECSDPHFSSNVCYDPSTFCPLYHCDQPTYSPWIYHPPWERGGEPRVDEQYVHLLCDTLTHVFFVHFGSKCYIPAH
jgi:hypothetical protein